MKPLKLRHLLSRFGEVGRIYLSPEDPAAYKRRVSAGGNKRMQYTEGGVEFEDKREARAVAAALHNTRIGDNAGFKGKDKRGFFADDIWSLRYLKRFKWYHLTEKVAYERRIRVVKLRAQLSVAKKEAEQYVARVDQSKGIEAIKERKAAKRALEGQGAAASRDGEADKSEVRRSFKQRELLQ
jgi:ESF2/ABP1 family protein